MPAKVDRAHRKIASSVARRGKRYKGRSASSSAWAIMVSKGMVRRKGKHMVATRKFSRSRKR